MIRQWHVPISGFTQSLNRQTGFDKLWRQLRSLSSDSTSLLPPSVWNANFKGVADFIRRMSNGEPPVIKVYAYSWGCGHGFIKLSKELRKRGLKVDHAVLCDPVYHSRFRPWRAMLFSPQIKIPDNVLTVDSFYQEQNKPRGTKLVPVGENTIINSPTRLHYNHEFMDDAPEFYAKCMEVAKS